MRFADRIERNSRVCNGMPVIRGTRIPVTIILEQFAEGETWENLLTGYPELTREDIQAALLYAKSSLDHLDFSIDRLTIVHDNIHLSNNRLR